MQKRSRRAGSRRAGQDQLRDVPVRLVAAAHADRRVQVQGDGAVGLVAARQPGEVGGQEGRVLRVEVQAAASCRDPGNDRIHIGEAAVRVDGQHERPGADPHGDVGLRPAHADLPLPRQLADAEGRHPRHQHAVGPGEGEAALHEELAAVRADDLAGFASELEPHQGKADGIAGGGLRGLVQRWKESFRHRHKLPGQAREFGHAVGCDRLQVDDLGHTAISPAGLAPCPRPTCSSSTGSSCRPSNSASTDERKARDSGGRPPAIS